MLVVLLAAVGFIASASSSQVAVRLHYFDIRGLAEPLRLTLADLGIAWEEAAHTSESWKEVKPKGIESGLFTFGQMPALEYSDGAGSNFTLVQSIAIAQFLGRRHGLYDTQAMTEEQIIKVDVVIGGVGDVRKNYGKMAYSSASDISNALEEYKGFVGRFLPFFERLAPARGLAAEADSFSIPEYICGPFSIADTLLYDVLDTCVNRVDPKLLSGFPKLRALMKRIEQRPNIAAYLKSPRRRNYANGPGATFDTIANPPAHLKASDEL